MVLRLRRADDGTLKKFLEVYQLLAYAKNEQFSETIPTTEGNITLNLDAHE